MQGMHSGVAVDDSERTPAHAEVPKPMFHDGVNYINMNKIQCINDFLASLSSEKRRQMRKHMARADSEENLLPQGITAGDVACAIALGDKVRVPQTVLDAHRGRDFGRMVLPPFGWGGSTA